MLDRSMLDIAEELVDRQILRTGILHPSTAPAVRQGFLGGRWYKGPIGMEELLAVQTTVLLHHRDVNEDLWVNRPLVLYRDF